MNLIIIGQDSQTLEKQRSILAYSKDTKIQVICSRSIIDHIAVQAQDEQSIVIINLTTNGLRELQYLNQLGNKKAAIIIVGNQSNVELLSQAIRGGVKEFIDSKAYETHLDGVFCSIKEMLANTKKNNNINRLNVIMGIKGGSGASFIASNVAYILAKHAESKVALLDLDLQFGSLGLNFDKTAKYSLTDAVEALEDLDSISIEAYMAKYNDKLSLLLPSATDFTLSGEVDIDKFHKMLNLLKVNYNQVVIDLPSLIDPLGSRIIEQADQITLVLQQSILQFRNGCRLAQILQDELEFSLDKITFVINRFDRKNSLTTDDLKRSLNHDQIYTISNDYSDVCKASNLGIPFCELSEKSKIAQELTVLAQHLGKVDFLTKKKKKFGLFSGFNF